MLSAQGAAFDAALLGALAHELRVFLPRVQPCGGGKVRCVGSGAGVGAAIDANTWLRDVIDGLGLDRPAICTSSSDRRATDFA